MAMQFMPPDFHHHHHHHHHIPPHPHTHAPPTPPNGKGSSNEPSSPQAPPLPPANLCHVWHPTTGQLIPLFNDAKDDVKKDKQRERKVIPILDPKTRTPVFVEPRKDVKPKQEESIEGKHTENKIEPTVETSLDIASIGLNLEEAMRKLKGNDSSSLNLNLYSLSLDEIAPPKKDSPKKPAPTPTPAPTSNQIEEEEEEFPPEEDLPPPPTVSHAVQQTEDLDEVDENFSQGTKTPEPTKSPPLAPKDKAQPWRPKTEHHPPSNTKVDWADVEVEEEEAVAPTTTTRGVSSWAQAARNSGGQQVSRRVLEQQQKATSLLREKEERVRKEREAKEKEDEEERQRKDQSDRFGRREPNQTGRAWGRGNNDREGGRPFAFGRDRGDREGSWNKGQGQFPSAPVRGSQTNSQTFPSRNGPSNQSSQPFRSAQQNSPSQNLRPNRPTPTPEVKPKPTPAQKIVVKEEDGWDVVISKKTIIENRKKGVEITVVKEKNDNSPPVPNGEFENRAKKTDDKTQKVKLNEEQLKPYRNKIRNLKKKLSDIDELKGKPDLNEDQLKKIKQENEIKKELEKAQSELNEYL